MRRLPCYALEKNIKTIKVDNNTACLSLFLFVAALSNQLSSSFFFKYKLLLTLAQKYHTIIYQSLQYCLDMCYKYAHIPPYSI